MSDTENDFYRKRVRELLDLATALSNRTQCEAITAKGERCRFHPWHLRDGRPVCTPHHRAKGARFAK